MLVLSTWHPPSAVSHSLKCHLTSSSKESLVIAKINTLEVHDITPAGLAHRCTFETWGTVTSLLKLSRKGRSIESLIYTTDVPDPRLDILDFDREESQLRVTSSTSLAVRVGRAADPFTGAILHPNGKVLVCCQYSGTIKVVVLEDNSSKIETEFECRIPELNILSLCFVPITGSKIVLAILSEDHHERKHLVARELKVEDEDLLYEQSSTITNGFVHSEAVALIPVPGQRKAGGVLVVGGGVCHFFGSEKAASKRSSAGDIGPTVRSLASTDVPVIDGIAYAVLDHNRWILGDDNGRLCLLAVEQSGPGSTVSSLACLELGMVSPTASIVHIDGPILYVGSLFGDSLMISLRNEPKSDGGYVDILQAYNNVGPILDAVLLESEGSGQTRVVTCSGESTSCSIRSIESSAELRLTAKLEGLPNVENIFAMRRSNDDPTHAMILVSTPFSTMVFEFARFSIIELASSDDFPGFIRGAQTLAACNASLRTTCVQVTNAGVYLFDMLTGAEFDRWPPAGATVPNITAATANASQVCVALKGGKLLYLEVREVCLNLVTEKDPSYVDGLPNEIASLSIQSGDDLSNPRSSFVAIGYWINNRVTLCRLPSLGKITSKSHLQDSFTVEETHIPQTLRLHSFHSEKGTLPYLLVGLADGTLVTYSHAAEGLVGRRTVNLGGGQRISLTTCSGLESANRGTVLAVGTRGVVLWFDSKMRRLRHSPVSVKGATSVCGLDHPEHPGAILLMSSTSTAIAKLGELDRLSIQTVSFGRDAPKSIAYLPKLDLLAVGCTRIDGSTRTATETFNSSLKLLDANSFNELCSWSCLPNEDLVVVRSMVLKCSTANAECIVVGTAMLPLPSAGEVESTEGRILVFNVNDAREILLVAAKFVPGGVSSVACMTELIAAAINSTVVIYSLSGEKGSLKLIPFAKWDRGYAITSIAARDNRLAIADCLRSTAILELTGVELDPVAYNYEPRWPVSIETLSSTEVIAGQANFAIDLFKADADGLERVGGIYCGEMVNKFVPGGFAPASSTALIKPRFVTFTATGRIGLISEADEDTSIRLTNLQRNMEHVLRGPGALELSSYRTPRTAHGTELFAGFIDGDFVEKFHDLKEHEVENVMAGRNEFERLEGTAEDVLQLIEQISSLH